MQPSNHPGSPVSGQHTPRPDNTIGLASMTLGVASIPLLLCYILAIPVAIVAMALGYIGTRRADRGLATNRGQAVAGLLCGSIGLILAAIIILLPDR
jgi:hypothetical protein